jgi:hypothetical protein
MTDEDESTDPGLTAAEAIAFHEGGGKSAERPPSTN